MPLSSATTLSALPHTCPNLSTPFTVPRLSGQHLLPLCTNL